MLFKILKLFGFDVPVQLEALRASFELRVEQATQNVRQVAEKAAIIAVFAALAAICAAMAFAVGLIAIYVWTAAAYGVYAGLGVVGALLLTLAVIFAIATSIQSKFLTANRATASRYPTDTAIPELDVASSASAAGATHVYESVPAAPIVPTARIASASDLVEPLSSMLSKFVRYPRTGYPIIDELVGNLQVSARGTADEALDRAADVIRLGDRTNLIVVLTGAAIAGWLLSHHSRR
jgi:ABC-type multidrug transport system fused ATPase/permease subunit